MTDVLDNGRVQAAIDPSRGARLTSLVIDGHELLDTDGSFPMVPWAGRIRDGRLTLNGITHQLPLSTDGNAIHGLGRNVAWDRVDDASYACEMGAPWPTSGVATLQYELRSNGLRTTLSWDDGTDAPCSIGLHPWFRRRLDVGGDVDLRFEPTAMVERGTDALPTGRLVQPSSGPWDDCFKVAGSPVLNWPGALEVSLSSSSPWWVVYDQPAETVCVEPQSAPPDAFAHPALQPDGLWPRSLWFEISAVDEAL
ncbi:aldose 1-epimerase [Aeromicrobium panaciterrae]|uniref:aldose 1-epimerase n=1 Tax=Aeromicrobium panaciterrae TaxID=363861 RepID=UPI0031DBAB05